MKNMLYKTMLASLLCVLLLTLAGCESSAPEAPTTPTVDDLMEVTTADVEKVVTETAQAVIDEFKELELDSVVATEDPLYLQSHDSSQKTIKNIFVDVIYIVDKQMVIDEGTDRDEIIQSFFNDFSTELGLLERENSKEIHRVQMISVAGPPMSGVASLQAHLSRIIHPERIAYPQDELLNQADTQVYDEFKSNFNAILTKDSEYKVERLGKDGDTYIVETHSYFHRLAEGDDFRTIIEGVNEKTMNYIENSNIASDLKSLDIQKIKFICHASWDVDSKEPLVYEYDL